MESDSFFASLVHDSDRVAIMHTDTSEADERSSGAKIAQRIGGMAKSQMLVLSSVPFFSKSPSTSWRVLGP